MCLTLCEFFGFKGASEQINFNQVCQREYVQINYVLLIIFTHFYKCSCIAVVSHSPCCSEDYQEDTWDVYARTLQTWKLTDGMDRSAPPHTSYRHTACTHVHTYSPDGCRQAETWAAVFIQPSIWGWASSTLFHHCLVRSLKAHSLLATCHTADMTFDTICFPLMPLRYGCILQLFMVNTSIDTLTGFWDCYMASQNWQHFSCVSAMQALQH